MSLVDLAIDYLDFLWQSFLLLSPMLLLGLTLAGLIHILISREWVLRWLRHDSLGAVSTSAAVGMPMPLCSCSVVPVVGELRRKGASRSSCMSMLITAPETGADSILVTYAFFGPVVAVVRPMVSFVTAVVAGIFCIGMIRGPQDPGPDADDSGHDHDHHGHGHGHGHHHDHDHDPHVPLFPGASDCYVPPSYFKQSLVVSFQRLFARANSRWSSFWIKPEFYRESPHLAPFAASSEPAPATAPDGPGFFTIARHVWRYGFVEVADDILFALIVGIAIGGLLYIAIPTELMTYESTRWLSYPIMVIVGIPLYICASASTPIAAALVAKGFSPGAALIFLMTGPATNTATIAIIMKQFGNRFAGIYVGTVIAVTVVIGIAADLLLLATGFEIAVNLSASDSPGLAALQWGGALALGALILWRFRAGALRGGYEDMMSNLRPLAEPWKQFWERSTNNRPLIGLISPRARIGRLVWAALVAGYLGSGLVVVDPSSVGYGRLFGKLVWRDLPPGIHYLGPAPFVTVNKFPVRKVRNLAISELEFVSGDQNLVNLTAMVQYRVKDARRFYFQIANAEAVIRDSVIARLRRFVGSHELDRLLNVDRNHLEEALESHFDSSDPGWHDTIGSVQLVKVNLVGIHPVPETMSAFRQVSSSQDDRQRIVTNAQRLLVSVIPQAHGNAAYERKRADGEAFRRTETARSESDAIVRIAAAVKGARQVLENMLWREKIETALSGNRKIIIPSDDSLEKIALWKRSAGAGGGHAKAKHQRERDKP